MDAPPPLRSLPARLVLVGLILHLLFCLQRLPLRTVPKQLEQISAYQRAGDIAYHLRDYPPQTRATLERLRQMSRPEHVIFAEGAAQGVMELAVALLHPRLVLAESGYYGDLRSFHRRPVLFSQDPELGEGRVVLVARGDRLILEVR